MAAAALATRPIDLAPAVIETSDNNWASNTTLDVNADFYVANRGNNTIVRSLATLARDGLDLDDPRYWADGNVARLPYA